MSDAIAQPAAPRPQPWGRAHDKLSTLVSRPLFWAAFILVGLTVPIVRTLQVQMPPPMPVMGQVPAFKLTDQYGKPFSSDDHLKGRVWVANFIFTRCPSICPVFSKKMFQIQDHVRGLGEAFHLVTFTVDPEFDKPEVLFAYARAQKASPRMWSFLTGARPDVERIVGKGGLNQQITKEGEGDDIMSIGHGGHFVLVDQKMQIRGYYDSSEPQSVDLILRDAGLLTNRGY